MSPERVRDELVRCFMSALACMPIPHGFDLKNTEAVRAEVEHQVRESFAQSGASFDHPTKKGILAAMGACRANAMAMHMPPEVVEEHWAEMMPLVGRLDG